MGVGVGENVGWGWRGDPGRGKLVAGILGRGKVWVWESSQRAEGWWAEHSQTGRGGERIRAVKAERKRAGRRQRHMGAA